MEEKNKRELELKEAEIYLNSSKYIFTVAVSLGALIAFISKVDFFSANPALLIAIDGAIGILIVICVIFAIEDYSNAKERLDKWKY